MTTISTQPVGSCSTGMIRPNFSHARTSRYFRPNLTGKKLDRFLMSSLSKEWLGTPSDGCFTTAERTSTWGSQQHPCVECLTQASCATRSLSVAERGGTGNSRIFALMRQDPTDAQRGGIYASASAAFTDFIQQRHQDQGNTAANR